MEKLSHFGGNRFHVVVVDNTRGQSKSVWSVEQKNSGIHWNFQVMFCTFKIEKQIQIGFNTNNAKKKLAVFSDESIVNQVNFYVHSSRHRFPVTAVCVGHGEVPQ